MSLSIDLRKRVVAAVENGAHIKQVAKMFNVGFKTIYTWLNLKKRSNSLEPKTGYQNGHSHKIIDWDKFKIFAKNHQKCTVAQMCVAWENQFNQKISESTMKRALKKVGYTSKKNVWIL